MLTAAMLWVLCGAAQTPESAPPVMVEHPAAAEAFEGDHAERVKDYQAKAWSLGKVETSFVPCLPLVCPYGRTRVVEASVDHLPAWRLLTMDAPSESRGAFLWVHAKEWAVWLFSWMPSVLGVGAGLGVLMLGLAVVAVSSVAVAVSSGPAAAIPALLFGTLLSAGAGGVACLVVFVPLGIVCSPVAVALHWLVPEPDQAPYGLAVTQHNRQLAVELGIDPEDVGIAP